MLNAKLSPYYSTYLLFNLRFIIEQNYRLYGKGSTSLLCMDPNTVIETNE